MIGLASAPIFPSMIATTPERLGAAHTANAIGFQIAAAALGQSLLPSLVGTIVTNFGLESITPALFVAALLLLAMYEMLMVKSLKIAQEHGPEINFETDGSSRLKSAKLMITME
jgi:MFS family permease